MVLLKNPIPTRFAGLWAAVLIAPLVAAPALAREPLKVVACEPEWAALTKELAGDHTIILSTHILPEVSMLCIRVVIIKKGTVAAVDTPEGLTSRLQGSERIDLQLGTKTPDLQRFYSIPGITAVTEAPTGHVMVETDASREVRPDIAKLSVDAGWDLLEMRKIVLSLEDIFLELTTQEEPVANDTAPETDPESPAPVADATPTEQEKA